MILLNRCSPFHQSMMVSSLNFAQYPQCCYEWERLIKSNVLSRTCRCKLDFKLCSYLFCSRGTYFCSNSTLLCMVIEVSRSKLCLLLCFLEWNFTEYIEFCFFKTFKMFLHILSKCNMVKSLNNSYWIVAHKAKILPCKKYKWPSF